jgi:RNA polymerase sigma-70 factor (ECF subfamily)
MERFEDWYHQHHPRLVASLTALSGDPDAAAEAADEAFVRAYERWRRVSTMESPAGWVHQVGANALRRQKRRWTMEGRRNRPGADTVHPPLPQPELWAAVRGLPPRQREAVVLRYLGDLPEAEIATAMGISRGTVSSTLADARRSLERILAPHPTSDSEEALR